MIPQIALQRRRDANVYAVGALSTFLGLLATVPIAYRQHSPRVWWMPFLVTVFIGFIGAFQETEEQKTLYKLFGWTSGGVVAGLVVQQNKEKAIEESAGQ